MPRINRFSDSFALAAEHVAWCLRQGDDVSDVLRSIGDPCYGTETWNDVIWAVAKATEDMRDPRLAGADTAAAVRRRRLLTPAARGMSAQLAFTPSLLDVAHDAGRRAPKRNGGTLSWEAERQPCGRQGLRHIGRPNVPPIDCTDMLVARPRPWILVIWEPLPTKAPGPHLALPYCCYTHTIIFYHRPYIVGAPRGGRDRDGVFHADWNKGFIEWDKIDTRLLWDDVVVFEGEEFVIGGGRVEWSNVAGDRRRWWMRRGARRRQAA